LFVFLSLTSERVRRIGVDRNRPLIIHRSKKVL
jgi:hypothetical protein